MKEALNDLATSPIGDGGLTSDDLAPLDRSSLGRRAAELIRRAIVNGILAPGEQITIHQLAERLRVSKTPVREALIRLEAIGLVEILGKRVKITSATPTALRDAFELRETLESMAARLAAMRRTDEQARLIVDLAKRSNEAGQSLEQEEFRRLDGMFHRAIGHAAGSPQLERYLSHALDLALTLRNLSTVGRRFSARAAPLHLAIAGAIEQRDGDAAARLSAEHVQKVYTLVSKGLEADGASEGA